MGKIDALNQEERMYRKLAVIAALALAVAGPAAAQDPSAISTNIGMIESW